MTDRKQLVSVIDTLIAEAFNAGADNYSTGTSQPPKGSDFYDRILAPLMTRDVPEEEISKIRKMIKKWCLKAGNERAPHVASARYHCASELENWVNDLKRLREGDHIAELGKSVGLRPDAQDEKNKRASQGLAKIKAAQPRGTCQKCGGTKKICVGRCPEIYPLNRLCERCGQEELEDCPQCDGTGDCQHKRDFRSPATAPPGWQLPYCRDCKRYFDRRSGLERRVKELERRIWIEDETTDGNRRTRTRRKAGSGLGASVAVWSRQPALSAFYGLRRGRVYGFRGLRWLRRGLGPDDRQFYTIAIYDMGTDIPHR